MLQSRHLYITGYIWKGRVCRIWNIDNFFQYTFNMLKEKLVFLWYNYMIITFNLKRNDVYKFLSWHKEIWTIWWLS